jgi:hypothetical protein
MPDDLLMRMLHGLGTAKLRSLYPEACEALETVFALDDPLIHADDNTRRYLAHLALCVLHNRGLLK